MRRTRWGRVGLAVALLAVGLVFGGCSPRRSEGTTPPGKSHATDADPESDPAGEGSLAESETSQSGPADPGKPGGTGKPGPEARSAPAARKTPVDPRALRMAKLFEQVHNPPEMANESAAIHALIAYSAAQAVFRRAEHYPGKGLVYANLQYGKGHSDLYQLGGLDSGGTALKLIDKALAKATSPEHAISGYYFVDITGDARTGAYDYSKQFGLCAVPVRYDLRRGPRPATLVVDAAGRYYKADTGGEVVTIFPDVTKGKWLKIGG